MRDNTAIIKAFEDAHGVKVDLHHYLFRSMPGRWDAAFLVVHAAGTDPAAWVEIDTDTKEEKPVTAPEYYMRARAIAEELYNEMMTDLDFSTIEDMTAFSDILNESLDDSREAERTAENEAEARARIERNRAEMEHAISETMMSAVDMFDLMTEDYPFIIIDGLTVRNYSMEAVDDVIELHKDEIEKAINGAHFIPEI